MVYTLPLNVLLVFLFLVGYIKEGLRKSRKKREIDLIKINRYESSRPPSGALQCEGGP
jgi:hypothetical protein